MIRQEQASSTSWSSWFCQDLFWRGLRCSDDASRDLLWRTDWWERAWQNNMHSIVVVSLLFVHGLNNEQSVPNDQKHLLLLHSKTKRKRGQTCKRTKQTFLRRSKRKKERTKINCNFRTRFAYFLSWLHFLFLQRCFHLLMVLYNLIPCTQQQSRLRDQREWNSWLNLVSQDKRNLVKGKG